MKPYIYYFPGPVAQLLHPTFVDVPASFSNKLPSFNNTNSLHVNSIGKPFVQLIEVESSNNYAMAQVQAHLAGHGATWFAHHQTAGKGQRGKSWNMEPGQNIMLSTVIEPKGLQANNSFILSAAVALACRDFFSAHATDDTKIKWPNDLYWKDRKAGGILIENVLYGSSWKFAIVGIGININQVVFSGDLPNPVSLKQITGKSFDTIELAHELCACIDKYWRQVEAGHQDEILQDYTQNMYKLNEQVRFRKDNAVFTAMVKGVNKQGELIASTGVESNIPHGKWEWIIG